VGRCLGQSGLAFARSLALLLVFAAPVCAAPGVTLTRAVVD
jgi:hypothetical protein